MIYSIYRIKKESKGSILFKQQRVGLNEKKFTCYKFRSMHEDGESNLYRTKKDSRVFKYGDIMRKIRIDELPQLWNVFKGDMHLIGPRAEWDVLVEQYEKEIHEYHNRHKVRPGITGLAQVYYPYGRNAQDTKNKLKYDIFYIQNWSLLLEIKIIRKTVVVIFGRMGV
jgi:lipopolysaccharide/colanic/teichoic acid biosynthesis glycosyltransferase